MRMERWNQGWKVWKETNAFSLFNLVPREATTVDLPYDAAFHQMQDPNSPNEGRTGFLNGGTWHFAKNYFAPEEERGQTIRLLFEGCAEKTYVFVNNSLAGENNYAYSEFYVDISSYLHYGQTNRILVTTTTLELSSRFYCGCGIYRDVYLCKGGDVYLEPEQLRVTTRSITGSDAFVCVDAQVVNQAACAAETQLHLTIKAMDGTEKLRAAYPVHLPGKRTTAFSRHFLVKDIVPWDAEQPALYRCEVVLTDKQGCEIDTDSTETGFRMVQVDAEHGLRINGQAVKLLGGCIHHDQGILGGETYDDYEYRRIFLLKQAGFNSVRCAHNPASKALLRACDRLGMYVLDEGFDMWSRMKNPGDYSLFFGAEYKQVLETMVRVDYNHPSVIMYSTGNEIMDLATDRGYELSGEMTAYLHQLDGTRCVTNATNAVMCAGNRLLEIGAREYGDSLEDIENMDVNEYMASHQVSIDKAITNEAISEILDYLDGTMDVIGYNYMIDRYEMDSRERPHRVIIGTETHSPRIADNWREMQKHPNIIGDYIWTSYGYLGETGGKQRFPALQNESCDLDITGVCMPTNYYRQVVLGQRDIPYIAVRTPEASKGPIQLSPWSLTDAIPCWDFPGCEGEMVEVEVYSGGDEVELLLNGVSCGRQAASAKRACQSVFRIPYAPGRLTAVSLKDGQQVSEYTLSSTGKATGFVVTKETYPVGGELVFLTIQAVNAKGEPVYAEIPDLTVALTGTAAKLQAFGSYDALHNGGYQQPVLAVKNGQALLILRRLGAGQATVTVSASGMAAATCVVDC